jgi:hypothetical protein
VVCCCGEGSTVEGGIRPEVEDEHAACVRNWRPGNASALRNRGATLKGWLQQGDLLGGNGITHWRTDWTATHWSSWAARAIGAENWWPAIRHGGR